MQDKLTTQLHGLMENQKPDADILVECFRGHANSGRQFHPDTLSSILKRTDFSESHLHQLVLAAEIGRKNSEYNFRTRIEYQMDETDVSLKMDMYQT